MKLETTRFILDFNTNRIIKDISKYNVSCYMEYFRLFLFLLYISSNLCHGFVGYSLRREYPPLSLHQLQMFIDTNRIDISKPIDLGTIINTGLYNFHINWKHAGVHLTDEVIKFLFKLKLLPLDIKKHLLRVRIYLKRKST